MESANGVRTFATTCRIRPCFLSQTIYYVLNIKLLLSDYKFILNTIIIFLRRFQHRDILAKVSSILSLTTFEGLNQRYIIMINV